MADRFWVGGAGTWGGSNTNWSATSGGPGGASEPTSVDNVFFNAAATYTVTANGGQCNNITVSAGTVTFNNPNNGSVSFIAAGNISITAATVFSAPANQYGVVIHQPSTATSTVSFGSSGLNTQKVFFNCNLGVAVTSYTFCTAATQTFHSVSITGGGNASFTCAGSAITIDNQERQVGVFATDQFSLASVAGLSVAGTTLNMGSATANLGSTYCDVTIQSFPPTAVEPNLTTFNINLARDYNNSIFINLFWNNPSTFTANPFRVGNLTIRSNSITVGANVFGIYGATAFTSTLASVNFSTSYNNTAVQKIFSGAVTLNGSYVVFDDSLSVAFQSTVTLAVSSGVSGQLDLRNNNVRTITFTGAVSMTGAATAGSSLYLPNTATINFSSTLTSTKPGNSDYFNFIETGNSSAITIAGNTSLTNTEVSSSTFSPGSSWVQTGTSTLTATMNPTTDTRSFVVLSLTMGTGAASFTSYSVYFNSVNGSGFSLQSSGLVSVTGAGLASGTTFTVSPGIPGNISFVAATLATWTDVSVSVGGNFTVTGVGGFTLAGTTKNSNINVGGALAVTGPTILNVAATSNPQVDSVTTGGGAFTINGVAASSSLFSITGQFANTVFSSTFTSSNIGISTSCTALTFTGAVTITNPNYLNILGTTTTISNALSITSATLIDGVAGQFGSPTFVFVGDTLTTSSTVTNWTFTNARIAFQYSNSATISNPISLVNNGGMYWNASSLTLTSALTSSGAGSWNVLICSVGVLTLNNAVTLVNCQLAAGEIVVQGGGARNFAYSLSSPIPNNTAVNIAQFYDNARAANYPQICVDTFTVTNSGATFSIIGGGNATLRTFVRPYVFNETASPACAFNLPSGLTPTFTDVDFWRVTAGGTITKPLTGTRLGNVGTISGITTATPKTVFWVGGAGAWDGAKWALTSGGAGSALNYPLPQDTVVFDANSGTGNFTYPASIRVKTIQVDAVPAGTSAVYCNAATILSNGAPAYLWVSGNIEGPPTTPTGTFILGNTSTNTYDSFVGSQTLQSLIVADGSSLESHVIRPTNMTFMPRNTLQFATQGTTEIQSSLPEPLFIVDSYCNDSSSTVNITAPQIGSSSFDYSQQSVSYIGIGVRPATSVSYGTVNYGSCSLYTYKFYANGSAPNTAYSVFINQLDAATSTTLGNINFTQGTTGNTIYGMAVFTVSCLSINIVSKSNSSLTGILFTGVPNISTYTCTVTYSGSITTSFLTKNGSAGSLTKLGGGTINLPGINVTRMNASPANTWYTTGVVTLSTGWNAGTAPAAGRGSFLLF
jgi:hypothetical protein